MSGLSVGHCNTLILLFFSHSVYLLLRLGSLSFHMTHLNFSCQTGDFTFDFRVLWHTEEFTLDSMTANCLWLYNMVLDMWYEVFIPVMFGFHVATLPNKSYLFSLSLIKLSCNKSLLTLCRVKAVALGFFLQFLWEVHSLMICAMLSPANCHNFCFYRDGHTCWWLIVCFSLTVPCSCFQFKSFNSYGNRSMPHIAFHKTFHSLVKVFLFTCLHACISCQFYYIVNTVGYWFVVNFCGFVGGIPSKFSFENLSLDSWIMQHAAQ